MKLEVIAERYWRREAELKQLHQQLVEAIRAERAKGATYEELLRRSRFKSMETIRLIVKPEARDTRNRQRRTGKTS